MGGLYRQFYSEIGDLNLSFGKHDIVFHRGYQPKRVLIHVNNGEGLPVCQGELNYVSSTILDDGFILHADIRSNDAYVLWVTTEFGGHDNVTTIDQGFDEDHPNSTPLTPSEGDQ